MSINTRPSRFCEAQRMLAAVGQIGPAGRRRTLPEQPRIKRRRLRRAEGHHRLRGSPADAPVAGDRFARPRDRGNPRRGRAETFGCGYGGLLGRRRGQRFFDCPSDELMDGAAVAKTHFALGRMDIDVDDARVDGKPQRVRRLPVMVQHVTERFAQGMRQDAVAHEAAVDEQVLRFARRRCVCRPHDPAGQIEARPRLVDRRCMRGERFAEQRIDAGAPSLRKQAMLDAAIVLQGETDIGMRQRCTAERLLAMAVFGGLGAKEFAARRRVEVELVHGHRRTVGERRRQRRADLATVDFDAPGVLFPAQARRQRQARYGGNACQRLAAKAQRRDRLEVAGGGDLGCRVARQRQRQILTPDAISVVGDANQLDPAAGEIDVDLPRAGVEAVLEDLLQRRGRPVDDFAGGDLVDQLIGQRTDRWHQRASPVAQRA
jgi:hypothetical protein